MVDSETGSQALGVYTVEGEFCLMAELQRAVKSCRESLGVFLAEILCAAILGEKMRNVTQRVLALLLLSC